MGYNLKMEIVCISDTHSRHLELDIPDGDLLIHSGDICWLGELSEIEEFSNFLKKLPHKHKIVIAGNHDFPFENEKKEEAQRLILDSGAIYLNDSGLMIEGLKIWGSPIQPEFGGWAFNRKRGEEIKKYWDLIPSDTDILITHGPPYGVLDQTRRGVSVGCEELYKKVIKVNPRLHVFGHIHEAYGTKSEGNTIFINACSVDSDKEKLRSPISISI